ncbi:MAG: septation protein IspZ, partial [Rhodospirillaceae bacterium]|nr:septation protein IspZ [Rhodospirillaceae bacterium]
MQALIDFLPIIVFFAVYQAADIYVATAALIVAMALQIGFQWLRTRTVNRMLLISGGLVFLFGGITLLFRNPIFIQWKPTVVNWLFAAGFLASRY